MLITKRMFKGLFSGLSALTLSACAVDLTTVGAFSDVEEAKGRVVLSSDVFQNATPFRVGFF